MCSNEKCRKCFLTPDMCGSKNKDTCERLYQNKISLTLKCYMETIGVFLAALVLIILAFSVARFPASVIFFIGPGALICSWILYIRAWRKRYSRRIEYTEDDESIEEQPTELNPGNEKNIQPRDSEYKHTATCDMKLSEFQYIITNIGGGWGYIHKMYGVTKDGEVFKTLYFDENHLHPDLILQFDFLCRLNKVELGLSIKEPIVAMDTSFLTIYEVKDYLERLLFVCDGEENWPELYRDIRQFEIETFNRKMHRDNRRKEEEKKWKQC